MRRAQYDRNRKLASMALVVGALVYLLFSYQRFYTDWARLVAGMFSPSVSGLALLIALAKYVLVGGDATNMFKGTAVTIAIIFGIGLVMGWIGVF